MPGILEALSSVLAASISCLLICQLAHCLSLPSQCQPQPASLTATSSIIPSKAAQEKARLRGTAGRTRSKSLTDLLLQGSGLTDGSPGQDARVGETGLQETAHDEEEEDGSDDGNGQGQCAGQVGTARKEESSGYPKLPTTAQSTFLKRASP